MFFFFLIDIFSEKRYLQIYFLVIHKKLHRGIFEKRELTATSGG